MPVGGIHWTFRILYYGPLRVGCAAERMRRGLSELFQSRRWIDAS